MPGPMRRFLLLTMASLFLSTANAMAAGQQQTIREHFDAIRQARDELVAKLAARQQADAKIEAARDITLTLHDAIVRRSESKGIRKEHKAALDCRFARRGGKWYQGVARAKQYNLAQHDVDPSGLSLKGDKLIGVIKVALRPDAWVPPDQKVRHMRYTIDAKVSNGAIEGTLKGEGDYEDTKARVTGQIIAVKDDVTITTLDDEKNLPKDPDEACRRMAVLATYAYQQSRAAAIALRHYPIAFAVASRSTRLAPPEWPEINDQSRQQMILYLAELRSLLERRLKAGQVDTHIVVETLDVEDPFFGPYFDDEPLPTSDAGAISLPADCGQIKGQRWQMIPCWQTIAAFPPDVRRDLNSPLLPEIIVAPGARYPADDQELPGYSPPDGVAFAWFDETTTDRFVGPPGQPFDPVYHHRGRGRSRGSGGVHGVNPARWYAFAEIISPREIETWAAVYCREYGKLWVNDELVWVSHRQNVEHAEEPPLVKVQLKKGRNTFRIVTQSRRAASFYWLMLSTGSGPLSAEARAAMRQQQREATQKLPPDPRRGRRGDWTSAFPDADPPLAWDIEKGINLQWRTPLPDYSNSNPIIVGDRVFVNCEPHTLYCLDKKTGEILWQRDSHIVDFLPEDQRAAARKAFAEGYAAKSDPQRKTLRNQLGDLENQLRELEEQGRLTPDAEKEVEEKAAPIRDALDKLAQQNRAYRRVLDRLDVNEPEWSNCIGWTFAAPCSDGEFVYVKYNTGVVACYDLEGNRQWMSRTHMSGGVAQVPSPILIDGKVVIQGKLTDRKAQRAFIGKRNSPPYFQHRLVAYDKRTGEMVWERPIWASGGYGNPGGVVPMRIADGNKTHDVIVTSTGLFVEPRNGELLSSPLGIGKQGYYGDPIAIGNRAFIHRSGPVSAAEVWVEPSGKVGSKIVVEAPKGGDYAGATYVDGYMIGKSGHPTRGRTPVPWLDVHVADMRTGEIVGSIAPALREGGLAYTPSASAGPYGVVTGTGPGPASWSIGNSPAEMGFVMPAPDPYMVSICKLDGPMIAPPIFEGKFMYVRTHQAVMCIGATTPEGIDFALQRKAQTILAHIPTRPKQWGVIDLAPAEGFERSGDVPVESIATETAPGQWLMLGPFDKQPGADPLKLLGAPPHKAIAPGKSITIEGTTLKVKPLDKQFVSASKGWVTDHFERRHYRAQNTIDLYGPVNRKTNSLTYYFTVIHSDKARTIKAHLGGGKHISAYLAGHPIEDGDRIRIQPGHYPRLLVCELGLVPPFGKAVASARFVEIDDPNDAFKEWVKTIEHVRPRLEEIARDRPDSYEASRARSLLKHDPTFEPASLTTVSDTTNDTPATNKQAGRTATGGQIRTTSDDESSPMLIIAALGGSLVLLAILTIAWSLYRQRHRPEI